jgi:hypothetical protein
LAGILVIDISDKFVSDIFPNIGIGVLDPRSSVLVDFVKTIINLQVWPLLGAIWKSKYD